jgi:hypothetical protein
MFFPARNCFTSLTVYSPKEKARGQYRFAGVSPWAEGQPALSLEKLL